jgi:hypothetical protein
MRTVSEAFLDFEKHNYPPAIPDKTKHLLVQFCEEYRERKPSELQIDGLSTRTRIYLLTQIIEEKRKQLSKAIIEAQSRDKNKSQNKNNFGRVCRVEAKLLNNYWEASQVDNGPGNKYWQLRDKIPITFTINKDYKYTLQLLSTFRQPGNGVITGIDESNPNSSLPYEAICGKLDRMDIPFIKIWEAISQQKQTGEPIIIGGNAENCLLNGYSFLLDFEIARRKVLGDEFNNLPLITCFPFLMKVARGHFGHSFVEVHKNVTSFIFTGQQRADGIKKIISMAKKYMPETEREMRKVLRGLHQEDEASITMSLSESQLNESQPFSSMDTIFFNSQELHADTF